MSLSVFLVALVVIQLVLLVVAVTVLLRTPDERLRHANRIAWLVIIIALNIAGPVAFLTLGRRRGDQPTDAAPASTVPAAGSAALLRDLYGRQP